MRIPQGKRSQSISAGGGASMMRGTQGSGFEGIAAMADEFARQMQADQKTESAQAERELAADDERTASLDATRVVADERNAWTTRLEEMATDAPEGAAGFSKSVIAEFDEEMESRLADADALTRPHLRGKLLELRGSLSAKAFEIQGARGAAKRVADINGTIRANSNAVMSDFTLLDAVTKESHAAIDGTNISEDKKRTFKASASASHAASGLSGLAERNPARALELLDGGTFNKILEPAQKGALIKSAKSEIKRRDVVAKRQAREAQAGVEAKLKIDLNDHIAKIGLDGKGTGVTFERLVKDLGVKRATVIQEEIDDQKQFYVDMQTVAGNTPAENAELLVANDPGNEHVARDAKQRLSIARAIEAHNKALAADPIDYIISTSPEARAIYNDLNAGAGGFDGLGDLNGENADPAGFIQYMENIQDALGVPEAKRRTISKREAVARVDQLGRTSAEDVADSIEQMTKHYGDNWPKVYGEMVDEGLPPTTQILANIDHSAGRQHMAVSDQNRPRGAP